MQKKDKKWLLMCLGDCSFLAYLCSFGRFVRDLTLCKTDCESGMGMLVYFVEAVLCAAFFLFFLTKVLLWEYNISEVRL